MSFVKNLLLRMFGRPKGVLGRLGGIIMARTNREIAVRAIELLDVRPTDKILEIGFGPGVGIQLLAGLVSSGRIVGIDDSAEMVEQAGVRNADAIRAGKVELRRDSAECLPFDNDTFDKVLAINSMQVWPEIMAGLRETWRVMKPGSRVVFGFHTPFRATKRRARRNAYRGRVRRRAHRGYRSGFLRPSDQT